MGKFRDAMRRAAEEAIGEETMKRREEWFEEECAEVTKKKNIPCQRLLTRNSRANRQNYKEKRKAEKRSYRRKKREVGNKRIREMEMDGLVNKARSFYATVNDMRKNFCPKLMTYRSKNRNLITDGKGKTERWRKYFSEHFNKNNYNNEERGGGTAELTEQMDLTEREQKIQ